MSTMIFDRLIVCITNENWKKYFLARKIIGFFVFSEYTELMMICLCKKKNYIKIRLGPHNVYDCCASVCVYVYGSSQSAQ